MFKLSFYVPTSHLESVKAAVFAAGAGREGDYDHCCWQTLGEGQFRALAGSEPHLGEVGKLSVVAEYKVEMACSDQIIDAAMLALKAAHPYEEPVIDIVKLEGF